MITISHDRHFLNEICTHIADIDYETIIIYPGGYDDMIIAKGQVRGKVEQENAERQKKVAQLQDFVARFAAGTRATQVQSRKKQIERLQLTDLKRSNIERPFIQFLVKKPSGKQTVTIENLTKRWPGITVCDNFSTIVTKGEKIAIIGKSGMGKTTLCKMLADGLKPDAGTITWGHQVSIGYLAQDHREGIPNGTTVSAWLHSFDTLATQQDIRGLLGKMLFKGEEGMKPTDALSGGEAVRMIFSKLMLAKDNVLVLDEPTNHLDLESIIALGDALTKYEGTAFVVTHDRDLVASFANRIFAFTSKGLIDWRGTYDDFLEKYGEDAKSEPRAGPLAAAGRAKAPNMAGLGLHALLIAIARRRVRDQRLDQVAGHLRDLCHRALELRLIRLRRLQYPAHLAHVLQRRRADLLFRRGRRKVEQWANVPAHDPIVNTEARRLKRVRRFDLHIALRGAGRRRLDGPSSATVLLPRRSRHWPSAPAQISRRLRRDGFAPNSSFFRGGWRMIRGGEFRESSLGRRSGAGCILASRAGDLLRLPRTLGPWLENLVQAAPSGKTTRALASGPAGRGINEAAGTRGDAGRARIGAAEAGAARRARRGLVDGTAARAAWFESAADARLGA